MLSERGHRERGGDATQVVADLGTGDGETNAQACQAVRLGEGPQDDDVRVVVEKADPVDGTFILVEVAVGLIHDDDNLLGHLDQELLHLVGVQDRPGRVVGGA